MDTRTVPLHPRLARLMRLTLLQELTTLLAHELTQPLAAIASFSAACDALLAMPDPDAAVIRDTLQQLVAQSLRAGECVHRLRRLAGLRGLRRSSVDVNELVQQMLDALHADARLDGVSLRFEPTRPLPLVSADGVQIQLVMFDLLDNAMAAVRERGVDSRSIVVATSRANTGAVAVDVADSGLGIAPDIAMRLFEPFFTTRSDGAGLGLAIGRSIVHAHDGDITYARNDPTGTRFTLTLPPLTPAAA